MYWPTSMLTVNRYIGRYVGRYLLDSRPRRWLTVNQFAGDIRSLQSIGRYFAAGSSAYHRHLASATANTLVEVLVDMSVDASVEWQSSIGCISVETWLVLDCCSLSVDSWPILC